MEGNRLMTENLGICSKCKSNKIVKNEHNNSGQRQYLCKNCKACRVLDSEKRYSESKKGEIIRTVLEGTSLRGVQRIFHVARQTVSEWLKKNNQYSSINRGNPYISRK